MGIIQKDLCAICDYHAAMPHLPPVERNWDLETHLEHLEAMDEMAQEGWSVQDCPGCGVKFIASA